MSRNATETFLSDTTVIFLPGVHYLSAENHIFIYDIRNLSLKGFDSPVSGSGGRLSHIVCTGGSVFYFINTINIKITNLTISRCGSTTIAGSASSLIAVNVYNLDISHTVIKNSTGYALFGIDVLGNSTIRNSHFLFNNYNNLKNEDKYISCLNLSLSPLECVGGGAIFIYDDNILGYSSDSQLHTLRIISSLFAYGVSNGPYTGSGLTVIFDQSLYGVEVVVNESVFTRNTARKGANLAFFLASGVRNTSVTIQGCNSTHSNYLFMPSLQNIRDRDYIGGGMYFASGLFLANGSQSQQANNMLKVYNTNFVNNSGVVGAAMSLDLFDTAFSYVPLVYVIENCSFVNNSGSPGSALAVSQVDIFSSSPSFTLAIQLVFRNCSFFRNSYPSTFLPNSIQHFEQDLFNVVFLNSVQDITFTNCRFRTNTGTALYAYATRLRFFGKMSIEQNSGLNGGGLSLNGDSLMLLSPNTHVHFLGNSAQNKGGGILIVNQNKHAKRQACFFQVDRRDLSSIGIYYDFATSSSLNIQLVLDRNTAMKAGSALYGGKVDHCISLDPSLYIFTSTSQFNHFFLCDNGTCDNLPSLNSSLVSSDPFQICFCDTDTIGRGLLAPQIMVYPGQTFNVSVSIFGQRMGLSPGVVFADFLPKPVQKRSILEPSQYTQYVETRCTTLTYTIFSQAGELNMILTLEDAVIVEDPTKISIQVLPCPPGFNSNLSPSQLTCQCDAFLLSYGVTCDITKGTIHRTQQQWMSINLYKTNLNSTNELMVHQFCPFDYCLPEALDFNLSNPDAQCAFNRTGILCGACPEGLSVTFGGSQCVVCSNAYLALIIPFAAAGLCLVLLLFIFNTLTVATGTLNGLVFYANIVQYNQGILFPPEETNVLTVFVSWINLDLGIHTCFYNGMDTYAKTWLQFVFPVYIWVIVVAIIATSKYSSRVAKLAGKNAVPVLATLGLLSFAKILRTIISALSFTRIYHSDGGITTRWLFDANIVYLMGVHIPLFLISVIVLLFLVLPFALLLTFTSQLLTLSSHRPFRWVNRLKPFFDAYQGPYKDKHRHWTGVLLIIRGLLFLIYSFNVLNGPGVILLVTVLASFLLVAYGWLSGGVYKKWSVNALELSFYLNLGFLASTSTYVRYAGGSQAGVIYTSTSIALVEFLGVIVYSFLLLLAGHFGWTSIKDVRGRVFFHVRDRKSDASQEDICKAKNRGTSTASVVSIIELSQDSYSVLREPLLEDNN